MAELREGWEYDPRSGTRTWRLVGTIWSVEQQEAGKFYIVNGHHTLIAGGNPYKNFEKALDEAERMNNA